MRIVKLIRITFLISFILIIYFIIILSYYNNYKYIFYCLKRIRRVFIRKKKIRKHYFRKFDELYKWNKLCFISNILISYFDQNGNKYVILNSFELKMN